VDASSWHLPPAPKQSSQISSAIVNLLCELMAKLGAMTPTVEAAFMSFVPVMHAL
jgi:hypothetical protein